MSDQPISPTEDIEATGRLARVRRWWAERRESTAFRWATDIAIVAVLFAALTWYQTRGLVADGEPVPQVELATLDGGSSALVAGHGRKTLVYAWAPWCSVCSAQSGTLSRASGLLGDRVEIRSVVLSYRNVASVRAKVEKSGVDYPVLLGDDRVHDALKVSAFPTIYVLTPDGRVEDKAVGYTTTFGLLWRAWF